MHKTARSSTKPIGTALEELVQRLGIKQKLQEYEAVLQWDSVVGEHVARVATPAKIFKGVLLVRVKTSTWRNELTMRKKEIIDKLNKALGDAVVKDIKFQ